jgi:hypothetical protein
VATPQRTYLSKLVKHDLAQTDLPLPVGEGQWGWVRHAWEQCALTERGRHALGRAEFILAYDAHGRLGGVIAPGKFVDYSGCLTSARRTRLQELLVLLDALSIEDPDVVLHVVLDGVARRIVSRPEDGPITDLELLAAAHDIAKGKEIGEETR